MPSNSRRQVRKRKCPYPHEQTWLREFLGVHGTDNVVRFSDEDLGGVSLVRVLQAILEGTVVSSEKCDGPGTICIVFYDSEEDASVFVKVHFISNEEFLTILSVMETKDSDHEPHQSA